METKKLLLIDGNSIMNRAFYGIMGSKMLKAKDGTYTNAVYGFLAILFKNIEELKPDYMAVSFDLKAKTKRHEMYEQYKANRHEMPDELRTQMPMIKEVLKAMNIDIVEKEGFEGDDILGTLARYGEKQKLDVIILSGDRDTFQLVTDKTTVRIPRTKQGKTETDDYTKEKILEEYGLEPTLLIDVKGLQGDTSDNIPGVPGIGPKTAIDLIKKFGSVENLYEQIEANKDDIKGKQRERLIENKDQAFLSKTLGTIDTEVPLDDTLEDLKVEEWNKTEVLRLFKEWNFKKYIERFNLEGTSQKTSAKTEDNFNINKEISIKEVEEILLKQNELYYYFGMQESKDDNKIIKREITSISIYDNNKAEVYYIKKQDNEFDKFLKEIFENNHIEKYGFELGDNYILLKQMGIDVCNLKFDTKVASYILDPTIGKYPIDNIIEDYLNLSVNDYLEKNGASIDTSKQLNLFDTTNEIEVDADLYKTSFYAFCIFKLSKVLTQKLDEIDSLKLFNEIDMPTVEVLADMQWNGIHVEEETLIQFGKTLKIRLNDLTNEIYEIAGEEFNINSPKQLGDVLFEKMKLTCKKKTKSGYSTAEDVLEKIRDESPIIGKILEYRQLAKLNSTYVDGLIPCINPLTKRIHSFFHQTITATGRISSTEPNLQNIPTRAELGKEIRKAFVPDSGKVYLDADYSQIELRVLATMAEDKQMIDAFQKGEDIHKEAAAKVLHKPIEEVTKEERSSAKAVNFGIVYGISDFGLSEQLRYK